MGDVPGLNADITPAILSLSRKLHNQFPRDTALPEVNELFEEFTELCTIVGKYNMHSLFRIRRLHQHITIPEEHIMLGTGIAGPFGYWTTPTPTPDIDLHKIRGHVFSVSPVGFIDEKRGEEGFLLLPSEFREGSPNDIGNVDHDFLTEFAGYVQIKGLENTFGLEAIQGQARRMMEFTFDIGSILLAEEDMKSETIEERKGQLMLRETSWTVTVEDEVVKAAGEVRCFFYPPPTGHVRVTPKPKPKPKPTPTPKSTKSQRAMEVVNILRDEGFLSI